MKFRYITLPLTLLAVSSSLSFAGMTDTLNYKIERCFSETEKTAIKASLRPCNDVIQSDFVNRENLAIALHNRGVIHVNAGKLERALGSFKRSLRFQSDKTSMLAVHTLSAIAQIYQSTGQLKLAADSVNKALLIDSGNSSATKLKLAIDKQLGLVKGLSKVDASQQLTDQTN